MATLSATSIASSTSASVAPKKPSPKKKINFAGPQSFVTIIADVEPNQQTFVVHKSLISHYSPFFQAAFESSFVEGQTQRMILEDVEGDTFGLLVNWLYTQKIEKLEDNAITPIEGAKLWILGRRFIIPKLQNASVKATNIYLSIIRSKLGEEGKQAIIRDFIKFIDVPEFEGTTFRSYVVDVIYALGTSEVDAKREAMESVLGGLQKGFVVDLAQKLLHLGKRTAESPRLVLDLQQYRVEEEEE